MPDGQDKLFLRYTDGGLSVVFRQAAVFRKDKNWVKEFINKDKSL